MNEDLISIIFNYIDSGYTYKSIIFTCKDWYNIMRKYHPNLWIKFCHMFSTILKFYPNKPWNWFYISQNPNLLMEIISNNPDKLWTSRKTRGFAQSAKVE
jgi:hypothetical protein